MKPKQLQLFQQPENQDRLEHGGSIRKGKRKLARPLDTKRPLHVVLRSTRARNKWSFLYGKNKGQIHALVIDTAERFGIKIFRFENVGNHIHLLIQGKKRPLIRAFLRVLPQKIMFLVTGARKGNPVGRFFDGIAYSRVVSWGRELQGVQAYLWKNALESLGLDRVTIAEWRAAAKAVPLGAFRVARSAKDS